MSDFNCRYADTVITSTVIRGDSDARKMRENGSCFRTDTNELRHASADEDALSHDAARFTKWIIFKHKKFSLAPDDAYLVRIGVQAMRDRASRIYFTAAGALPPT